MNTHHHRKGMTVIPTEPIANPASTPKAGRFVTLCALLHTQGTSTPSRNFLLAPLMALVGLCCLLALASMNLLTPAAAGAYATPGSAPVPGSPGLPDGRVYELVSPANKPGTEAADEASRGTRTIWAAADGNSVGFITPGPMGMRRPAMGA